MFAEPYRCRVATLAASLCLGMATVSLAESTGTLDKVRAAYLYQFTKFVAWPGPQREEVVIGLLGRDALGGAEATIEGRRSQGRVIRVVHIIPGEPLPAACCDVLYVGTQPGNRVFEIASNIERESILVVAELAGRSETTAETLDWTINLVQRGTRLKFEVNLGRARDSGLQLSSELLKSAVSVLDRPGTVR